MIELIQIDFAGLLAAGRFLFLLVRLASLGSRIFIQGRMPLG